MAPLYESPPARLPLTGTGVGTASYAGPAKVVRDASEALRRLEPGDVLVTGTTTPAFNTVLPMVGAFVVEHGGQFSHSAIMANELGKPAVVGVHAACELIRDGQEIEVDPVAGVIKVRV
jgi:pyruvate,water dikinase